MYGLLQPDLPLSPAFVPDRLTARDGLFLRGAEPDLSILGPHRGDQAAAQMVRGGDEHAVAPPRPSRSEPALSRCQLRSEEHTSELQSLMRNSHAVFCLKKQHNTRQNKTTIPQTQNIKS